MFPLIPPRFRSGLEQHPVAISAHELVKAHIGAQDLADALEGQQGRYWRNQAVTLATANAVPLIGYVLLDWPVGLLVLAIAIDNVAVWLGDLIKQSRAGHIVDMEVRLAEDAETATQVAWALMYPVRARRTTVDSPHKSVLTRLAPKDHDNAFKRVLHRAYVSYFVFFLPALSAAVAAKVPGESWRDGATWALLCFPLLVRPLLAIRQSDGAVRDTRPSHPGMYPQATEAGAVFLISGVVLIHLMLVASLVSHQELLAGRYGLVWLLCYLAVSIAVGALAVARMRKAARRLRAFASQDREQLRARLKLYNDPPGGQSARPAGA